MRALIPFIFLLLSFTIKSQIDSTVYLTNEKVSYTTVHYKQADSTVYFKAGEVQAVQVLRGDSLITWHKDTLSSLKVTKGGKTMQYSREKGVWFPIGLTSITYTGGIVLKDDGRCNAFTKAGSRCKRKVRKGKYFCWQHIQ